MYLCDEILDETKRVLLRSGRNRKRYRYTDADVATYVAELAQLATVVADLPTITIVRDPNDDMVVACTIAADANYIVTRDKDLLDLQRYRDITILSPEDLLARLRGK